MKKNLNYENLMNANFDGESYELEFQESGKSYFIKVDARDHEEAAINEDYFDDKKLVENILEATDEEEIEEA
ncbi:MAG: hypothetical protein E6987_05355 [Peptoniphilus harei]|nr:hypothetical protein [Peptoniphilus harei]